MVELLVGAVNIRNIVIGAFRQSQDGAQVDHLDMGGRDGGVASTEQLEQPQLLGGIPDWRCHGLSLLNLSIS